MRLRERDQDPNVKRELEAIDAALRGERVDPDLADLAELATDLLSARPGIEPGFAARLDDAAAEGFPAPEPRAEDDPADEHLPATEGAPRLASLRARFSRLRDRPLLPAIAGSAAALFVALVVATSLLGEGDESGTSLESVATEDQATLQEGVEGAAEPGTAAGEELARPGDAAEPAPVEPPSGTIIPPPPAPPVPPARDQLKPGRERIQERSASMTLSAERDEVAEVADEVVEVVERHEGIVVASNVSTGEDRARAQFDLRIPTASLPAALADLSDLASVSSRDEGVLDITAPFVTAEERFADAKAEVDALLFGLSQADSAGEIAEIRSRLRVARGELAAARSELAALKQRADFSRLSLTITSAGDADGWSIGDAADDALSVLEDLAGAALVTLAVLLPLGALVLVATIALKRHRRRRRERALD